MVGEDFLVDGVKMHLKMQLNESTQFYSGPQAKLVPCFLSAHPRNKKITRQHFLKIYSLPTER